MATFAIPHDVDTTASIGVPLKLRIVDNSNAHSGVSYMATMSSVGLYGSPKAGELTAYASPTTNSAGAVMFEFNLRFTHAGDYSLVFSLQRMSPTLGSFEVFQTVRHIVTVY